MSTLNVDKVDPSTGTALEIGTSGDTITVPSGATFVVAGTTEITGTNNVQRPNAKPLIINGDMAVAQRATAATTITHAAYNTIDRWSQNFTASTMVFTAERSTTVPSGQGFGYSWKIDCTTAEASLDASSRLMLYTRLEGQDCQLLKFGTASAETITLSFWVRSNKTGTYQVNLWNSTLSGYISSTYAISSGDTWEKKVLTFVGDQNTALANTNASALQPEFVLVGGGNYTGGTMVPNTTTTWPSYVTDTRAANQGVNLADSDSNDFYITGVQLEVGEYTSSTIPPFQFESYGDNLQRCLRYFQTPVYPTDAQGVAEMYSIFGTGVYTGDTYVRFPRPLPVEMRVNPTLTSNSGTNYFWISSGANDELDDLTIHPDSNYKTAYVYNNDEASGTAGQGAILLANDAAAYLWLNAEL